MICHDKDRALKIEADIVASAINVYGGGFMKCIGIAMQSADIINLRKIKTTWAEEWKHYLEMGKMMGN